MADVKISALPAATTVAGTDQFETNQSGTSRYLTAELLRAFAAGGLNNRLINGEFRIWQRGTSLTVADDAYAADRWYVLTQTNTITAAREADPWDGASHAAVLTQTQASAQRIGWAQIIEGKNCKDLRGGAVCFSGQFKISANQDVRIAILENTGTEDTVTSDVVNDWTSTTYTASNFFIAGVTVAAVKEYASPGTGVVDFFIPATLSSSLDNAIVFIWTEGTLAQNGTLRVANCDFARGSIAPAVHVPRQFTEELLLCQRYYQKSFALDTTPAQNAGGVGVNMTCTNTGVASFYFSIRLMPPMRSAPTGTFYNPQAANAQVRNVTDGADCTDTTVQTAAYNELFSSCTTAAGAAPGELLRVNFSADSEL